MTIIAKSASRPTSSAPLERAGALALALLVAVLAAAPADARHGRADAPSTFVQGAPAVNADQAATVVSADQAAAAVRAVSGGRILDVRLQRRSRPPVYRVKVLLDGGRVRVYRVDATTGEVLG